MPYDHELRFKLHGGREVTIQIDSGGGWVRVDGAAAVVAAMPLRSDPDLPTPDGKLCAIVRGNFSGAAMEVILDREPEGIRPMVDRPTLRVYVAPPFLEVWAGRETGGQRVAQVPLSKEFASA